MRALDADAQEEIKRFGPLVRVRCSWRIPKTRGFRRYVQAWGFKPDVVAQRARFYMADSRGERGE
jgi:hypothetical protein